MEKGEWYDNQNHRDANYGHRVAIYTKPGVLCFPFFQRHLSIAC